MSALVAARNIHKKFPTRLGRRHEATHAVRGVSLEIQRRSIFGLVGESGCGKSTLARAILYLDPPSSGSSVFDGRDLSSMPRKERRFVRRKMQIVFQDPHGALNPKLRIRRCIGEALDNRGVPRREQLDRVARLLSLVGLPADHMDRYPHSFSGGQKQRIVIARALAMEPEFLILDEPVSNLDVSIQAQIINLLLDLKDELGLTYLFISHDLHLISYVSDRIAVMKDGIIVEEDDADTIVRNPKHPYTRTLFESAPVFIVKRRFTEQSIP